MKKLKYFFIVLPVTLIITAFISTNGENKKIETENCSPVNNETIKCNFNISVEDSLDIDHLLFRPDSYSLDSINISVMNGANTGLDAQWCNRDEDNANLKLSFFLPSGLKFKIWNEKNLLKNIMPVMPFTLTEKEFEGIKTTYTSKNIEAYIRLARLIPLSVNDEKGFYTENLYFKKFKIIVDEFFISGNTIGMHCKFDGSLGLQELKSVDANYTISGEFSFYNMPAGVKEVKE